MDYLEAILESRAQYENELETLQNRVTRAIEALTNYRTYYVSGPFDTAKVSEIIKILKGDENG